MKWLSAALQSHLFNYTWSHGYLHETLLKILRKHFIPDFTGCTIDQTTWYSWKHEVCNCPKTGGDKRIWTYYLTQNQSSMGQTWQITVNWSTLDKHHTVYIWTGTQVLSAGIQTVLQATIMKVHCITQVTDPWTYCFTIIITPGSLNSPHFHLRQE